VLIFCGGGGFTAFTPEGSDGEKLLAARLAAQSAKAQEPPNGRSRLSQVLRRDALQSQIAAISAVSIEKAAKRDPARAKPALAR
jgi:hypothetical protein